MSDQNINPNNVENEEIQSTIFSDPAHFNDTQKTEKRPKKRLLIRALSAVLAVGILAGVTAICFKYIPEISNEVPQKETITVTSTAEAATKSVTFTNKNGTVKLNATLSEENGESTVVWDVDGVDKEFISSDSISSFVSKAINLTALQKLAQNDGDFGFSSPAATLSVSADSGEYTVYVGKSAPADLGYYCKTTLDSENIFIIDGATAQTFIDAADTDFATTIGMNSVKDDKNADCFAEEEIIDFDYIAISGKKHAEPFKIVLQEDEAVNAYFAFKMVKPVTRICDNTAPQAILSVFAKGFSCDGAYAYSADKATLKKYGLDNPDYVVEFSINGVVHTLKFSQVDNDYAAFIDGKTNMVKKISLSAISYASAKIESYYSTFVTLENLGGLKQMKVKTDMGTFVFDIKYTEGADEDFEISYNGKKIDVDKFKTYYGSLIGMTPISFETQKLSISDVTITFVHSSDIGDTVLEFKKCGELRYQSEIDGVPTGQITSTALETFISDTVKIANGTY